MEWQDIVIRRWVCNACKGAGGWQMADGWYTCKTCNGTKFEEMEIELEKVLGDSKLIGEMQDAITDILKYYMLKGE